MSTVRRVLLLSAFLLSGGALPASAQQAAPGFSVGVRPDTVTVGERFFAVLRVQAPPGARVELPARPDSAADLQAVGERIDRGAPAAGEHVAAYPMVAWRPGEIPPPSAAVRVAYPDGRTAELRVPLQVPFVRSVLPADTAGLRPRGAKDVLGSSWSYWLFAAAIALLVLLLAPSAILVRRSVRRRLGVTAPAPPPDPRTRALERLDRARRMRFLENGDWPAFYALVSGALRGYVDALSPRWGEDLTTPELLRAMEEDGVDQDAARRLAALLAEADRVKFARARTTPAEAVRHWSEARRWIEEPAPAPAVAGAEPQEVGG